MAKLDRERHSELLHFKVEESWTQYFALAGGKVGVMSSPNNVFRCFDYTNKENKVENSLTSRENHQLVKEAHSVGELVRALFTFSVRSFFETFFKCSK
ncbi:hypothetical protein CYMTET_40426 [Cymbomonas tetramitiformis]|uniref:Uncharacterized protein n=1 Tax=Cymbomonas tetramitiformis TaxID=36881 RepID=A0AAE0BXL4_9CHLO|nr:hypothetical protein CYMTET_46676 [Cymbomonas tetramitiformis]KAK3250188.1 hypothetical protein CYMTET_40426 [Cymbomonas tetramitiformis]